VTYVDKNGRTVKQRDLYRCYLDLDWPTRVAIVLEADDFGVRATAKRWGVTPGRIVIWRRWMGLVSPYERDGSRRKQST
jgi:hypothetical protein